MSVDRNTSHRTCSPEWDSNPKPRQALTTVPQGPHHSLLEQWKNKKSSHTLIRKLGAMLVKILKQVD